MKPQAARDAKPDALARAHVVRDIAELLATDAPFAQLWEPCRELVATLMAGANVTLLVRDEAEAAIHPGSVAGETLASGQTVVRRGPSGYTIGVPIRFGRTLYGALCAAAIEAYDPEQLTLFESCALNIGARLYHEQHTAASERFARLAFTDGLTGIANRRRFDESYESEWLRAARDGRPLSVLMIDLDFFKSFNDNYGHQSGDLCLQRVAHALHDCLKRPGDVLARYGGEEFVAMLPDTDLEGAIAIGEDMRAAVAALAVPHQASSLGRLSLSLGASSEIPEPAGDRQRLLQNADDALYRAKLSGRNRVYARGYDGGDADPARPRGTAAHTNLPLQLTRLIGRKEEIADIASLMERHRLVSIVGAGGTGKTRAAIAVASQTSSRFADGAWFVDLSPIADPTLIASTIAAVFRAEVSIDESAADALAVVLESKDVLLVLDNCEHLVSGVANLAVALLRRCHRLNVLTTSREPLGVAGEAIYRLPLLALPPADARLSPAEAVRYDAIALFVERATEAKRDFTLTDANLADAIAICRSVDGIALAIELAASRAGTIGLSAVAARLRDFRLLAGVDRIALPRQRTMHAMIGWSYDLLDESERALFLRLSIFAGSFTFDAVTEICWGRQVEPEDVFDVLTNLIRKSLVTDDPARDARYRLLDPVRAFAREKLLDAGETELLSRRHAEYYEATMRHADAMYRKTPSREWLEALAPDVDNFRGALEWSLDRRGDVVLGATLAAASINFFNDFMPSEATRWMIKALEILPRGAAPRIEARLCFGLATSSRNLPAQRLRSAGERAIEITRQIRDRLGLCEALRGTAQILGWYFPQDRALADELALESIEIARELGDPVQIAISLRTRGLTIDLANFEQKRAVLEESLELIRAHGNERQIASMLTWISDMEFSAGDRKRAMAYGREAIAFARSSGSNELYTTAAVNLAHYAVTAGDWETARSAAGEAVRVARKTRHFEGLTFAVQAFAALAAHLGDPEHAARLIGFCDARCGSLHPQRQADQCEDLVYRALMRDLHAQLDPQALAKNLAAGANLNEEEAVALSLVV